MTIKERLEEYTTYSELYEILEDMDEIIGTSTLLLSITKAMTSDDLKDILQYIAKEWDI